MTPAESEAAPPATGPGPPPLISPQAGALPIWLLSLFRPEAPSLQPTSSLKSLHFLTQRGASVALGSPLSSLGVR